HPELKQAIDQFEVALEKHAFENTVDPPARVKTFLNASLRDDFILSEKEKPNRPEDATPFIAPYQKRRTDTYWKYLAAASIILLLTSTALNFYFYSNFRNSSDKYQALLNERNTLQADNKVYESRLNNIEQSLKLMEDPRMISIKMPGMPGKEQNLATVFWNTQTKEVYLYPNSMARTPPGKQYQLWAIVDGKPVNAGMVGDCEGLCKMKVIDHAEAFAITLENAGGSNTPTVTAMYVMGKV
ncbi:MAG TPA: anti-sigma factor, partial [Parafilimonas sp.]|nr:anti-sigma factor [Parafilimonas sp.]